MIKKNVRTMNLNVIDSWSFILSKKDCVPALLIVTRSAPNCWHDDLAVCQGIALAIQL